MYTNTFTRKRSQHVSRDNRGIYATSIGPMLNIIDYTKYISCPYQVIEEKNEENV